MRLGVQILLSTLLVAGFAADAEAQPEVAGVAVSPADEESLDHLEGIIGQPLDRRHTTSAAPADVVRESSAWPDRWVVLIDNAGAMVWVIRPGDRVIVSRVLERRGATPYAAAVVAAELLRIAGEARPAEVEPNAPRQELERQARQQADSVLVEIGVGVDGSGDPGVGIFLLRPSLSLGLAYSPTLSSLQFFAEVLVALCGDLHQMLPGDTDSWVDYSRHDVSLRAGVGWRQGPAELSGFLTGGVALVTAEAGEGANLSLGGAERASVWLGGGARARVHFDIGLFFGLEATAIWLPKPREFFHRDRLALSEGNLRVGVGAQLGWSFGI